MTAAAAIARRRAAPSCPFRTRIAIFVRLLAIQGSWNYETLLGNGIGFCIEPALRLLPGGIHTPAFHAALARESRYFNAHPYLASVAVGALARAELDGEPPARIERFRTALCGPLGSVGDRLVWAGWLPFCSLASLGSLRVGRQHRRWSSRCFLVLYNVGHFGAARLGAQHGLDARSSRGVGARAIRCFAWPAADRPARGARDRNRDSARARPHHRPGRNLLGGVLVAVALGCVRHRPPARVASKGGGSRSSCSPSSSSSR